MMNYYQRFAANEGTVGDWEGEEELAAAQVNRIYAALNAAIPPNADPIKTERMFSRVWTDWCSTLRLLDLGENDIKNYTRQLIRRSLSG